MAEQTEGVPRGRRGGTLVQRITALCAQVARLEGRIAAKDAALRELEWTGRSRVMECPFCEAPFAGGKHRPSCKWIAALSDTGEGWPEVREQAERERLERALRWALWAAGQHPFPLSTVGITCVMYYSAARAALDALGRE